MRVVRLPWGVAGCLAALCHLPLFLLELTPVSPPSPDELQIDLQTLLPEPEPEPEDEPTPKPPPLEPLPPEPAPPEAPPEPALDPLPEEPPSEEPAPTPEVVPADEPAPEDVKEPPPTTTTDTVQPTDTPRPVEIPPPPPPPPPPKRNPFDPRAYRDLAFALVDRQKRYPRKARVLGLEGTVTLMIYLDENGRFVRPPRVHKSSGHKVLDEEAVRMVQAAAPFPKPDGDVLRVPIIVPLAINFRIADP